MKDDPAIAVVRDARHLISEKVGHEPRKLVEYYQKLQQRHRERLIENTCPTSYPSEDKKIQNNSTPTPDIFK